MLASIRAFLWRMLHLGRRRKSEAILDGELGFHLQMEIEDNLRRGMSPIEARRRALIALGGQDQTKEAYRETRSIRWLDEFRQDLRYGIRTMARNRGVTIIALAVLALGIGSTTTIYSVVNGVLLRALPFPQSEQLVQLNDQLLLDGRLRNIGGVSVSSFLAHKNNNPVFRGLAQYNPQSFKVLGVGNPEYLKGVAVTVDFFDLLQMHPLLGRTFTSSEEDPGGPPVALLTHSLWQSRFSGSRNILGSVMRLEGVNYTIIGVMPRDFVFPSGDMRTLAPSLFVPLQLKKQPSNRAFRTIGRLRPGMPLVRAQEVMSALVKEAARGQGSAQGMRLQSVYELTVSNYRITVIALLGAVGLVLAIGCVNVANLLLASVTQRQREFAVRSALGAGTGRLVRQLLIESTMLGVLGGTLGILLSIFAVEALRALHPPKFHKWRE